MILKIVVLIFSFFKLSHSLPLSTNSRWIVDEATSNRVKLTCGNWPSHLEPMIAEGLEKKPLSYIVKEIVSMGFNCVRFTYATYMFTRHGYSNLSVRESLNKFSLNDAKNGFAKNNPEFLDMSVVDVHKSVVDELGKNNVMVILDNHVSKPGWCCNKYDGNGFFGDQFFDPQEWIQGWKTAATRYKGNSNVVAMSMRNELRGPRENENDWYKYMEECATTIHEANSNVLIIFSGLSFDTNLRFLKTRPVTVNIPNKLVYEYHWYSFGEDNTWVTNTNARCAQRTQAAIYNSLFLLTQENPVPLFLSEFGLDLRGGNEKENRYFTCLLATLVELDIDWALWTLQGSYILREGMVELDEVYGTFDFNWDYARNKTTLERLQLPMRLNQDSNFKNSKSFIMFHPHSGKCVNIGEDNNVRGASCDSSGRWSHQGDGSPIMLEGVAGCLQATGEGRPVSVSKDCSTQGSTWKSVSASRLQLASQDKEGYHLCLEYDPMYSTIVTKRCLCIQQDNLSDLSTCDANPQIQWFKFVPTNT
ncbi:hypothetical protein LIER_09838 [Lithospermum erythrorhizon]|uniref:Glycoside hydrolase family 5 domain-containing protein n=1 Tax=Lithospermum erythrorhizon TaxID=34254 RepID=A0AAV3PHA9_LITER